MKKWMCILLVFVFLLVGCGGGTDTADNDTETDMEANLIYENTISPNEKYVENEEDLVYYTVKVYRKTGGLLVMSHSNSAFSKDMQYKIETDADITKEDITVQWQTLSGETTDSQKNQFGLADVTVSAEGAVIDRRVISFVGGAVERIADAVNPQ